MPVTEPLLPKHGGYRRLKSFQVAQLVYDLTVRFCDRWVSNYSRTRDQMVQAARSGVQNIAEGSVDSGTSKKSELKLTNIALGSLEELKLDYEDFLRHRGLSLWVPVDERRLALVQRRCENADQVAAWVREICGQYPNLSPEEAAANAIHTLTGVASSLLQRQLNSLSRAFEENGDFTQRINRLRRKRRD